MRTEEYFINYKTDKKELLTIAKPERIEERAAR